MLPNTHMQSDRLRRARSFVCWRALAAYSRQLNGNLLSQSDTVDIASGALLVKKAGALFPERPLSYALFAVLLASSGRLAALALLDALTAAAGRSATTHGSLELTARREAHRGLRRDVDRLMGTDVGSTARCALGAPKRPKAGHGDVLAGTNLVCNGLQRRVDNLSHLTAAVALRARSDIVDQIRLAVRTLLTFWGCHSYRLLFSGGRIHTPHHSRPYSTPAVKPLAYNI